MDANRKINGDAILCIVDVSDNKESIACFEKLKSTFNPDFRLTLCTISDRRFPEYVFINKLIRDISPEQYECLNRQQCEENSKLSLYDHSIILFEYLMKFFEKMYIVPRVCIIIGQGNTLPGKMEFRDFALEICRLEKRAWRFNYIATNETALKELISLNLPGILYYKDDKFFNES
jgi:hypothetical protein